MRSACAFGFAVLVAMILPYGQAACQPREITPPPAVPAFIEPRAFFSSIGLKQGLPSLRVTSIFLDSRGFLWIGTLSGLSRYDGYESQTYRNTPETQNSLAPGAVVAIGEDPRGRLWLAGPPGTITRFDPVAESFTHFQIEPALSEREPFTCLHVDAESIVWIGSREHGLIRFDPATATASAIELDLPSPAANQRASVWSMDSDAQGRLWFTTSTALHSLEPGATTSVARHPLPVSAQSTARVAADGVVWVAGHDLLRYALTTDKANKATTHLIANAPLNTLLIGRDGDLWMGGRNGLYRFDPDSQQVTHFSNQRPGPKELRGESVMGLVEDRDGVLCCAMSNAGVQCYDPRQEHFKRYDVTSNAISLKDQNVVGAMLGDGSGDVWLGRDGAVGRLDMRTRQVLDATPPELKFLPYHVRALCLDSAGALWAGARDVLARIAPSQDAGTIHTLRPPDSETPPTISDMVAFGKDKLMLATLRHGLFSFDLGTETFAGETGIPAQALALDSQGDLWVAGHRLLARRQAHTGQWQRFESRHEEVRDLAVTQGGDILVAASNGLFSLQPESGRHASWDTVPGLAARDILTIQEDAQGRIWLATDRGLSRLDPKTKDLRDYDAGDGLPHINYSAGTAWQGPDGVILFGGLDGMLAFHPDELPVTPSTLPLLVTSVTIDNAPVSPGPDSPLRTPAWAAKRITLEHDHRSLTLGFALLNLAAPEATRYRYIMENLDPGWVETDAGRRVARYVALPAGTYTFRVQAYRGGQWLDQEASLAVTVLPPWWKATWCRACLAVLLLALLYGVYRLRVRAIRLHNVQLEAQVVERTRELAAVNKELLHAKSAAEAASRAKSAFLANMSHELRTPLNAILGFSDLIRRKEAIPAEDKDSLAIISRSGDHLLSLINQVLDLSKIEAERMTLNPVDCDLDAILADVRKLFSEMVATRSIFLDVRRDEHAPRFIHLDDVKLRQVLINLVSNAVKFTESGGVNLLVESAPIAESKPEGWMRLRFTVRDSGVGVPKDEMDKLFEVFGQTQSGRRSAQGAGLGLPLSRKMVHLMGGDMAVESAPGVGTTITFEIDAQEGATPLQEQDRECNTVIGLKPGQPQRRIMIADDNEENRELIVRLLAPMGFAVKTASDGSQALELWREWRPDFILMDMRMPVVDGYEATRVIKSEDSGVIVVAFSASSFQSERQTALDAGCDDYLRKPMKTPQLFEMLEKHLGIAFICQNADDDILDSNASKAVRDVTSEALQRLPPHLRNDLRQAVAQADQEQSLSLARAIAQIDQALAAGVTRLVETYRFDLLQDLLEQPTRPL